MAISGRIERLLVVLGEETKPRKEIMAEMELNGRRSWRVNHLNPAVEQGYVRMSFPESPNSPDQAYRLTEKGLEWYREYKQKGTWKSAGT